MTTSIAQWIVGTLLIFSSLGVILAYKPVHACLSFLFTLLCLASLYLFQSAEFIAIIQILVYAGAILVLFTFVMVLFQDAHTQIEKHPPKSSLVFRVLAAGTFLMLLLFLGRQWLDIQIKPRILPEGYGTVHSLGYLLYVDFFFPFEVVILLFLVALIGSLYIGKKEG